MKKFLIFIVLLLLVSCSGKGSILGLESTTPTSVPNYLADGSDSIVPDLARQTTYGGATSSVGNPAYGYVVWEDQKFVYIEDVNLLQNWNVIAGMPGTMYVSADFLGNDYTKMYAIAYTFDSLDTIDVKTGKTTRIGKMAMFTPTGGWTGLSGTKTGVLYIVSVDGYSSYLYTVNPLTATTTFIGKICDDCTIIDIAITDNYVMYGVDIHQNVLMNINSVSAKGSIIGSIGFDANHSQDMDYDNTSRKLYLAAYNETTGCGELRIANTNTGMTTLVSQFPNCDEVSGFSFLAPTINLQKQFLPIILKDSGH